MDIEKIGKFIKKLRVEKGLSQNQLADMIPISRQAISSWENGKSLPNSDTLIIIGKIFDVTVDELLSGGEEKTNMEEIALNLVDEYNSKGKKLKRTVRVFVATTIILVFLIFSYYFITSYNSIKVYKISGKGELFSSNRGILIVTKEKSYLQIGKVFNKKDKKIQHYELYYLDKTNKKHTLYNGNNSDIAIRNYYGYDEYFQYKDIKNIINKLYLEIRYDNKKEKIKLKLEQDFINGFFFKKTKNDLLKNKSKDLNKIKNDSNSIKEAKDVITKQEPISDEEEQLALENQNQQNTTMDEEVIIKNPTSDQSTIVIENPKEEKVEVIDLPTEIDKVMKEKGQETSGSYVINTYENDKNIKFTYLEDELILEVGTTENQKMWDCLFNSNIIFYIEFQNEEEIDNRYISLNDQEDITQEDENKRTELIDYIKKYALEK